MMAEDSAMTVTAGLFDHVLPLVPGLDARLEAGHRRDGRGLRPGSGADRAGGAFPAAGSSDTI
jgi:hypothetical protein